MCNQVYNEIMSLHDNFIMHEIQNICIFIFFVMTFFIIMLGGG